MPVEMRRAFCKELKARSKDNSLNECLNLKGACDEVAEENPPTPDCGKPTPWFDRSTPCTDVRSPIVKRTAGVVTVSMCGLTVFRGAPKNFDDLMLNAYEGVVRDWVRSTVGDKVCCSSMLSASRTGKPCDPAADIDCDGTPNQTDINTKELDSAGLPDISIIDKANGAQIDPFPKGMDQNDPDFRPERTGRNSKGVGECPCKWELIKGDMKCSRNRAQPHVYTATWRCPVTKAEVFTTKEFAGSSPCQ
jgi:hypothetical protein